MTDSQQMNMRAIGKRIGMVRRMNGLSPLEFARRLQVPALIAEIAEHGLRESNGQGLSAQYLPVGEMVEFLRAVSRAFDVSADWLAHGRGDVSTELAACEWSRDELTIFFPVSISEHSLADILNQLLALMDTGACLAEQILAAQQEYAGLIVEAYKRYDYYAMRAGRVERASSTKHRLLDMLEKTLACTAT